MHAFIMEDLLHSQMEAFNPLFNHNHELFSAQNSQIWDGWCWEQVMWRAADCWWMLEQLSRAAVVQICRQNGCWSCRLLLAWSFWTCRLCTHSQEHIQCQRVTYSMPKSWSRKSSRTIPTLTSAISVAKAFKFSVMINLSNCLMGLLCFCYLSSDLIL